MQVTITTTMRLALGAFSITALAACGGSDSSNAPPVFASDTTIELQEDSSVTGTVSANDPDNDSLTYSVSSAASNGVFELEGSGSFEYIPAADFYGTDTVSVQASDGSLTAMTQITFTVINVNDAPVLQTSNVAVSSEGKSTGTINVTDADNDTITFAVISPPQNGSLDLDTQTGELTYIPETLTQIDSSFDISFTDGHIAQPLTATITLTPSFVTNADKLNYYFSSEQSHLKQAETLLESTNDQAALDKLIAEIAKGYFSAGFDTRGQALIDSIQQANLRAEAIRHVAIVQDRSGRNEMANTLRERAASEYNFYLSQKGIDNLNTDDAKFFQELMLNYLDAGARSEAESLLSIIRTYADAVNDEEYTTSYLRLYVAASGIAEDLITGYQRSKTEEARERALFAVDFAAYLAENTGYRERNGERNYRTRAYFMDDQAVNYFLLQETDKAKDFAARTLSLFTDANYDPDHSYPIAPYAQNTYASSLHPVEIIAGLLEALYPNLSENPALAIIDPDDDNYDDAQTEMFGYQIANDLVAGKSIEKAVAPAYAYYITERNDYRGFYETLFEDNLGAAGGNAGRHLIDNGHADEAIALLDYAFSVLMTDSYLTSHTSNSLDRYVTGDWGCFRLLSVMDQFGQDITAYQEQCAQAADDYIATANGYYTSTNAARAYRNLIAIYAINGNQDGMRTALAKGRDELALISTQLGGRSGKFDRHLDYATLLASRGLVTESLAELSEAIAIANKQLETAPTLDIIQDLLGGGDEGLNGRVVSKDQINATWQTYSVITQIRRLAGKLDNYEQTVESLLSDVQSLTVNIRNAASELGINQQQSLMSGLVELYALAGMNEEAKALIDSDINAPADRLELRTSLAEIIATRDDFPASDIALIDTDNDGLPTFFLLYADEEDIATSGLTGDDDSDNDGVADENDLTPLGD